MNSTDAKTSIVKAIKKSLNNEGEDKWGVMAFHMSMTDWNSQTRRCNGIASQLRVGFYLMHSVEAELNGRSVMWLHFAYED